MTGLTRALGRILLVRHAMPAVTADVRPERWVLSDAGRAAARALRRRLPDDAYLVASDEPKAWQTLVDDGAGVHRDPRFGEVRRDEPFGDGFRERRLAWVEGRIGPEHRGWEARDVVASRFEAGICDALDAAGDRPLVVASHGMAMTAWLASVGASGVADDPGGFWSGLAFPDLVVSTR